MTRIIINIVSFILAVYLSIKPKPITNRLKAIVWIIVTIITIANIYIGVHEPPKPFVDALIPNISTKETFNLIKDSYRDELIGYDLVDIIGSSYICLNKPDVIFHRFPEWTFIFRKDIDHLLEFKVSDSRVPNPPSIAASELSEANDGKIAYYIVSKKGFYNFGDNINGIKTDMNYAIDIIDHKGRAIIIIQGRGPDDDISETEDGINSKVLARVQIVGRPTDNVYKYIEVYNFEKKSTLYIKKAESSITKFYASITPIINWNIDAERAIDIAINLGAKSVPPGKERVGGHPTVRLYDGRIFNLQGTYWKIPYTIAMRPLLIDSSSGKVYAVNNDGKYSTEWESSFPDIKFKKDIGTHGYKDE
jgi:hypothetical protein